MNNFTKIENDILEELITSNLSKSELCICLFVLRKTNGFHKVEDEISYSQFIICTGLSRQTVASALKQLRLVNILRLVKKGKSQKASNRWSFNKDKDSWQLVKRARLVKFPVSTSQVSHNKLVNITRHTKERTKEKTKERESQLHLKAVTILKAYNKLFNKKNTSVKGFIANLEYWNELKLERILLALCRIKASGGWKEGYIPTLQNLFRRKNPAGEPVNHIEDAFNTPASPDIKFHYEDVISYLSTVPEYGEFIKTSENI